MALVKLNDLARHTQACRDEVSAAIARVVESGWFILGPELEAFEREFADYCGVGHAVGVANGTEAIELALRAFDVGVGSEVVIAANAGFYSATALRAIGATPVFADVDDRNLTLDPAAVAAVVRPATRAVIATHLYGRMADMRALRAALAGRDIALIEDCAQAHGASLDGRRAGSWGDAATFSFYPTKNLGALGDGGMITCNDRERAERLRRLRQYGWSRKYVVEEGPARNSRLDEIQAAVLRAKLPSLDRWNRRRCEIAAALRTAAHPRVRHPDVTGDDYVAHLYVVRTDRREDLRHHLAAHDIGTDIHYPVLDPAQPVWRGARFGPLPVSDAAVGQVLSLPCYPELEDAEIERVRSALLSWHA